MTLPTIHTTARGLRDLLSPVMPFADKGDTLPQLAAFLIRGHGEYITALATDRYRIGVKRAKIETPETLHAILPITSARQMLAMFKPSRRHDPELTITFDVKAFRVTVESGAAGFDMLDARVGFPLVDAEYPASAVEVITKAAEAEPIPAVGMAFNPSFLADFRHVATWAEPMQIRIGSKSAEFPDAPGPLFVTIGDDFMGALMPLTRVLAKSEPAIDPSWAPLLAAPKKPASRGRKVA